jgi:hypothetical protein
VQVARALVLERVSESERERISMNSLSCVIVHTSCRQHRGIIKIENVID